MTKNQKKFLTDIAGIDSEKLTKEDLEIIDEITSSFSKPSCIISDKEIIRKRMLELADLLEYDYNDISWLEKAMHCTITDTKMKVSKNREGYTNGRMASLGNAILKMIIADALFDNNKSLLEIDMHKNRAGDYHNLLKICCINKIYHYAYCDTSEYDAVLSFLGHAPLPAHDLYIEAIIAAIYKDKGLEYTREWAKDFFSKNGFVIGETPIYENVE